MQSQDAGYYSVKKVTMCCAERVKSFVLVGDAVWMETGILVRLRRMILRIAFVVLELGWLEVSNS